MADQSTLGMMFNMAAGSTGGGTQAFTEQVSEMLMSISQQLEAQAHSYQNWGKIAEDSIHRVSAAHQQHMTVLQQVSSESDRTYSKMGSSARTWSEAALEVSSKVTAGMLQQADAGQKLSASHAASQAAMAATTVLNQKSQAVVKAAFEAAEAVAAAARWDFEGAALHALASAEFAAIAGSGGGTGSGLSRSQVQQGAMAGTGSPAMAAGQQALLRQGSRGQGGSLHVIVMGPAQQALWFAGAMRGAQQAGHFLPSSNTARPAPAVRSG